MPITNGPFGRDLDDIAKLYQGIHQKTLDAEKTEAKKDEKPAPRERLDEASSIRTDWTDKKRLTPGELKSYAEQDYRNFLRNNPDIAKENEKEEEKRKKKIKEQREPDSDRDEEERKRRKYGKKKENPHPNYDTTKERDMDLKDETVNETLARVKHVVSHLLWGHKEARRKADSFARAAARSIDPKTKRAQKNKERNTTWAQRYKFIADREDYKRGITKEETITEEGYDKTHGSPFDRGAADAWYHRPKSPHKYPQGTYRGERVKLTDPKEIAAYHAGYDEMMDQEGPHGGKQWEETVNEVSFDKLERYSDAARKWRHDWGTDLPKDDGVKTDLGIYGDSKREQSQGAALDKYVERGEKNRKKGLMTAYLKMKARARVPGSYNESWPSDPWANKKNQEPPSEWPPFPDASKMTSQKRQRIIDNTKLAYEKMFAKQNAKVIWPNEETVNEAIWPKYDVQEPKPGVTIRSTTVPKEKVAEYGKDVVQKASAAGKWLRDQMKKRNTEMKSKRSDFIEARNQPPAKRKKYIDVRMKAQEETITEGWQIGDEVVPNLGPHKGHPHKVIHVFDNGEVNIVPTNIRAKNVRYHLGAARAKPNQIQRFRSTNTVIMPKAKAKYLRLKNYEETVKEARRSFPDDRFDYDPDDDHIDFADPGGRSALRAATRDNPRIHPCPSCGAPNRLTKKDVQLGYQCDTCADKAERGLGPED